MRHVVVLVPRGDGRRVMRIAASHEATNVSCVAAEGPERALDRVELVAPNARVEGLVDALSEIPDLHATLAPQGVIPLGTPHEDVSEAAREVEDRSPVEVYLGALQSIGSWKGLLGYAAASAITTWIGLLTDTIYLLTAAMLIAPFAGPAMTAAIGTARGDATILGRSVLRYVSALAVSVVVAWLLTLAFGLDTMTATMVSRSKISAVAVLIPLTAGAAGAFSLTQSERNSLVSGAAVGMLVAASLAPPAGLVGIAVALRQWDVATDAAFVLALQFVGINASGALVFRLSGLGPRGARYDRGHGGVAIASAAVSVAVLAGLVVLQAVRAPELLRSSREQRAASVVRRAVDGSGLARLVEANARFTRADVAGQNTLLVEVRAQKAEAASLTNDQIRARLTRVIGEQIAKEGLDVTPVVDVTVLDPATPAR